MRLILFLVIPVIIYAFWFAAGPEGRAAFLKKVRPHLGPLICLLAAALAVITAVVVGSSVQLF